MKHYIGLDVSMKRTFICVINEHGKIVHEGSENTDPHLIANYLSKLSLEEITVGFESGSLTPYLMTGFKERAIDAVCMDARRLSPILALKINKTDKNEIKQLLFCKFDLFLPFSLEVIHFLSTHFLGNSCLNIAFRSPILHGSPALLLLPNEELTLCSGTTRLLLFAA